MAKEIIILAIAFTTATTENVTAFPPKGREDTRNDRVKRAIDGTHANKNARCFSVRGN